MFLPREIIIKYVPFNLYYGLNYFYGIFALKWELFNTANNKRNVDKNISYGIDCTLRKREKIYVETSVSQEYSLSLRAIMPSNV